MRSTAPPLRRVLRAVPGYRPWVLVAALLSFVSLASGIGLIATSAYLIDRSALVTSIETLALTILAVRVLALTRVVSRYFERYLGHLGTFRLLTRIRVWFFRGIEPGAPASLVTEQRGDHRIIGDVDTLQDMYLRVVGSTHRLQPWRWVWVPPSSVTSIPASASSCSATWC